MYFITCQIIFPIVTCNLYIINYKFCFFIACSFKEYSTLDNMKAFMHMWRMDIRIRPYVIRAGFYGVYRLGHIMIDWPRITCLVER